MIELKYRLRFHTPAFLGNADQAGQWRTPPIKALLRQWWRVAYAAGHRTAINLSAMKHDEGQLFGVAADSEGASRKSQVRLRLDRWDKGRLNTWAGLDNQRVQHPEVRAPVGAHLYLGYGPLVFGQGQTALKNAAAIQANEFADLSLAFLKNEEAPRLHLALALMQHYGTLGGRSRNGWGSFDLMPANESTPALDTALDASLTRPWRDALQQDWPHAIGSDESGPLIWRTEAFADWKAVMGCLARIKIDLRTQFVFNSGRNAAAPELRHWLSYPVTNHSVRPWGDSRLPNSLRFKVRMQPDGKLYGVIFHLPCLPPPKFQPDRGAITTVWTQVHRHLQTAPNLNRIDA